MALNAVILHNASNDCYAEFIVYNISITEYWHTSFLIIMDNGKYMSDGQNIIYLFKLRAECACIIYIDCLTKD